MARERAWPSVVLPTPGTPSMSRCPRAKMLTRARRTTSPFPIPLLSGRWLRAMERWQSRATLFSILLLRCAGAELREYSGLGISFQPSALSLKQIPPLSFALDRNDKFFLWDSHLFIERNCSPYLQPFLADSSYCINSAGLPVRRSMRLAIGG